MVHNLVFPLIVLLKLRHLEVWAIWLVSHFSKKGYAEAFSYITDASLPEQLKRVTRSSATLVSHFVAESLSLLVGMTPAWVIRYWFNERCSTHLGWVNPHFDNSSRISRWARWAYCSAIRMGIRCVKNLLKPEKVELIELRWILCGPMKLDDSFYLQHDSYY